MSRTPIELEIPKGRRTAECELQLGESTRIGNYILTVCETNEGEVRVLVEVVDPNLDELDEGDSWDDSSWQAWLADKTQISSPSASKPERDISAAAPIEVRSPVDKWNEAKNQRRCDLIDKKYANGIAADGLTPDEQSELRTLQEQMERFRQQVAPLPLKATEALYQQLMAELGRVTERDGDVPV